jgi:hypothetical protein
MSVAKIGRTIPDEVRAKMSATHKKRFENPEVVKERSEMTKNNWQNDDYRNHQIDMRKEYWSDEEHRKEASERGKQMLERPGYLESVKNGVNKAFQREDVKKKIREASDRHKRPVIDQYGIVYDSVQEAAEKLGLHGSSIIKQISGRYKTAGKGYIFSYYDKDAPHKTFSKPVLYLLCGVTGAGKSWVAKQLTSDFDYVSFDEVPKKQHLTELMRLHQLNGRPLLHDLPIKISTFIDRHKEIFDIHPVFILESEPVVHARILQRGGVWTDHISKRMRHVEKRYKTYGGFAGSSAMVLEHLRQEARGYNKSV